MAKQLGGFNVTPRKDSFAAKVARADNPDIAVDSSELTEAERVQLAKASNLDKAAQEFKFVPANQAIERVEIIFDNSGSMSGEKIKDAKEGCTTFMKECIPNETAIRITPVDTSSYLGSSPVKFTCNLPLASAEIQKFTADGGTPLYDKLKQALTNDGRRDDLKPSRIIAFSDGQAGDGFAYLTKPEYLSSSDFDMESETHRDIVKLAKESGIIIDTCYIADARYGLASEESKAEQTMQRIAQDTGGIFIKFERGKSSFAKNFKYLTKGNRLLLTDQSFKAKLEAGQI